MEVRNPQTDDELVAMVLSRYELARGYWEPMFEYWRKLLRDYRMDLQLVRDADTGEILFPYRSKNSPPSS